MGTLSPLLSTSLYPPRLNRENGLFPALNYDQQRLPVSELNGHFQTAFYFTSLGRASPLIVSHFLWLDAILFCFLPASLWTPCIAVLSFSRLTLNIRIFQCLRSFSFFYWYAVPRLPRYASSFYSHLYADDSPMCSCSPLQTHISL